MSKAVCCDRCGTCFNPESLDYNEGQFYLSFKNPKKLSYIKDPKTEGAAPITHFFFRLCFNNKTPEDMIDLCDNCSKEFLEFMGVKQYPNSTDTQESNDSTSCNKSKWPPLCCTCEED